MKPAVLWSQYVSKTRTGGSEHNQIPTILQIWKRRQYSNCDALSWHWDRRFSDRPKTLPIDRTWGYEKNRYPSKHWSQKFLLLSGWLWKEPAERGFLSGSLADAQLSQQKFPNLHQFVHQFALHLWDAEWFSEPSAYSDPKVAFFGFLDTKGSRNHQCSAVQCSACGSLRFSPLLASVICLGSSRNEGSRCSNGKR